MKILFVCDTMGSGGAERVISILSNSFSYRNHEVSILMLSSKASEPFYNLDKHIKEEDGIFVNYLHYFVTLNFLED